MPPGVAFRDGGRVVASHVKKPFESMDELPAPAYDLVDLDEYFRLNPDRVVDYEPGRRIDFELKAPRGLVARHRFEVEPEAAGRAVLRHTIDGRLEGWARLSWPLAIRPLHDALIEDLLDRAEAEVTGAPGPARGWTRRVRVLRWAFGKARRA